MSTDEPLPLVRPYALTRGRTKPTREYPLEALVTVVPGPVPAPHSPEDKAIHQICRESRSVAEIAALMKLPLGVVRVLVGDLVDRGMLQVHAATTDSAHDVQLLERVLRGLRKL